MVPRTRRSRGRTTIVLEAHEISILIFNYATNTTISRQAELNPSAAISTIRSGANYQTEFGPVRASVGGSQTQFLGRPQLDRTFPTLNLTSKPIAVCLVAYVDALVHPGSSASYHLDAPSEFSHHFITKADGALDSALTDRNTRTSNITFGTPIKAGNFTINASFNMIDRLNDFPEAKLVIDPADTSIKRTVVYKRTYLTTLDWTAGVNLPQWLQGNLQRHAERYAAERRPERVLGSQRAHRRRFRKPVEAIGVRDCTSPTYFRSAATRVWSVRGVSPFDHAIVHV